MVNSATEDWTVWLKEQRRRAVNFILTISAALGLLAVGWSLYSLWKGTSTNWLAYSLAYLLVILLLLFSRRFSDRIASIGFVLFSFGFGLYSFYTGWLAGGGRLFLVMTVVVAMLLFNRRVGLLTAVAALLAYLAFAVAYGTGWLVLKPLPVPNTFTPMFIEGVGFALVLAVICASQWYFGQALKAASRANHQAQKSRAVFHNIVDRSAAGIVVIDRQGQVLFANQSALRFFNRTAEEWVGQPSHFPLDTGRPVEIRTERAGEGEGFHPGPGIAELTLDETEWEDQPAYLAIMRDITGRKQAENERELLISDLERKNTELERFTYTVSHDLKSPLVTITGYLGYIEKDARAGKLDKLQEDIRRISSAAGKMQALLQDLLELSRIGRLMNEAEQVNFSEIVQEALSLVHGKLSARGVSVRVAEPLPLVYGDRTRLVELVQNLLDNAAKFMGDQPEPCIEIGARGIDEGGEPIFYVRDDGIGIDPQYHERIFGLFNKLDPQTEGTGIGLALVKRIVEVHGGRVWVESAGAGQGATFCFTLPAPP